jgi:hypothetical protein
MNMKAGAIGWLLAVATAGAVLTGGMDAATQSALKLQHLLKAIEAAPPPPEDEEQLRSAEIREEELNAYIAYRLQQEKVAYLKNLRFKLLDENRLQGAIKITLAGLDLPKLLPSEVNFSFEGTLESGEEKARFNLTNLLLEDTEIRPELLDLVLVALAKAYEAEPVRINDWMALPFGIQRIDCRHQRATLYY